MNFIKYVFNKFKKDDPIEKVSIASDVITIFTFFTAIILSPKILSLFYHFNPNTYASVVLATAGSIVLILLFLIGFLLLYQGGKLLWINSPLYVKLLYLILFTMALGGALAVIPPSINFFYKMALK